MLQRLPKRFLFPKKALALTCSLLLLACAKRAFVPERAPLPRAERWIEHVKQDLVPFWTTEVALGNPVGNFPTFRCDDGKIPDLDLPCAELAYSGPWISQNLDKDYTRMKSRQTYFYGVAYHLTGDPKMLEFARAGVDFIRQHALEPETGSAITFFRNGVGGPPVRERTTQDLAYAQLGMGFYYYLTRDPEVLKDILGLKKHIFETFWSPEWGMLRWTLEGPGAEVARQELVSQLDQINAYMLLLTPILPEPHQSEWKADLVKLSRIIKDRFYSPELGFFWGSIHRPDSFQLGSHHTDFGHTIKSLWMLERVGRLTGEKDLVDFAVAKAPQVLEKAFLPDAGCWATGIRRDKKLDVWLSWWTFAELDQMTATLALYDPKYTGYLERTSACWFDKLVDKEDHEVWGSANPYNEALKRHKAHLWKNGYHSAEHALVSYVTYQALHARPALLYFAFEKPADTRVLRPYFFSGEVRSVQQEAEGKLAVEFEKIR